jgi:hypothetical protein
MEKKSVLFSLSITLRKTDEKIIHLCRVKINRNTVSSHRLCVLWLRTRFDFCTRSRIWTDNIRLSCSEQNKWLLGNFKQNSVGSVKESTRFISPAYSRNPTFQLITDARYAWVIKNDLSAQWSSIVIQINRQITCTDIRTANLVTARVFAITFTLQRLVVTYYTLHLLYHQKHVFYSHGIFLSSDYSCNNEPLHVFPSTGYNCWHF